MPIIIVVVSMFDCLPKIRKTDGCVQQRSNLDNWCVTYVNFSSWYKSITEMFNKAFGFCICLSNSLPTTELGDYFHIVFYRTELNYLLFSR